MIYNSTLLKAFVKEARFRDISFHSNRKQLLSRLSACEDDDGDIAVDDEIIDSLLSIYMCKNSDMSNDVRLNYVHLVSTLRRDIQSNELAAQAAEQDEEQSAPAPAVRAPVARRGPSSAAPVIHGGDGDEQ